MISNPSAPHRAPSAAISFALAATATLATVTGAAAQNAAQPDNSLAGIVAATPADKFLPFKDLDQALIKKGGKPAKDELARVAVEQAQVKNIVFKLSQLSDALQRPATYASFNHCQTPALHVIREMYRHGSFGAVFLEAPLEKQDSFSIIQNYVLRQDVSQEKKDAFKIFFTGFAQRLENDAKAGCNKGDIIKANVQQVLGMVTDVAARGGNFIASDFNDAASEVADKKLSYWQGRYDQNPTSANKRQLDLATREFDKARHNEKQLADQTYQEAVKKDQNGRTKAVLSIGGPAHYFEQLSPGSDLPNPRDYDPVPVQLKDKLNQLTIAVEARPGEFAEFEKWVEAKGNTVIKPDVVVVAYGPNADAYLYEDWRKLNQQASPPARQNAVAPVPSARP